MKKIICICNTYYQLIFALQLKKTVYANDYIALLLSDHSKNALSICRNLEQYKCFDEIKYVETKSIDYSFSLNPYAGNKAIKQILKKIKVDCFDEMLVFNLSKSTYLFFSHFCKRNIHIKVHRFEEGVLSYNTQICKLIPLTSSLHVNRLIYPLLKFFRKYDMMAKLEKFYCYYPEIYNGNLHAEKIPLIQVRSDVAEIVAGAFGVNGCELKYEEKYIFFTSVYDFEGGEAIGELELVRKIADVVGKDNLLIKMHPRDTRTVYADEGFHIDTNSSIPFEALLFAHDFSDKVLLTATSGAVLSASLMIENPPKTYYMYPLCKLYGNPTAKKTVEQIDDVLCHGSVRDKMKQIHICSGVCDIIC